MFDVEKWRTRFPVFERRAYINSCSYGALADSVRNAMTAYLDDRDDHGSDWGEWVVKNEALRTAYARLLGAHEDEIAVTASASAGINSVASALDFSGKRNKIVITDFEFPTAAQIWHAQEKRGARIVHAKPNPDSTAIPIEELERLVDDETLLVSTTHVCYRNGARVDVEAAARLAHERGALYMVDSYQALGSFPIDVKTLDVDFLVGGCLKYLLGTAGVAMLYVRAPLVPKLTPTVTGWFAQENIHAMDITANRPSETARRFEGGTPPVPNLYGALAGLELVEEIGVANIRAHVLSLHEQLIAGLDELGAALVSPREPGQRGAMLAIRATDDHALVDALAEENIVASCRDGNLRVSPHFYNSSADIDQLLRALRKNKLLLA